MDPSPARGSLSRPSAPASSPSPSPLAPHRPLGLFPGQHGPVEGEGEGGNPQDREAAYLRGLVAKVRGSTLRHMASADISSSSASSAAQAGALSSVDPNATAGHTSTSSRAAKADAHAAMEARLEAFLKAPLPMPFALDVDAVGAGGSLGARIQQVEEQEQDVDDGIAIDTESVRRRLVKAGMQLDFGRRPFIPRVTASSAAALREDTARALAELAGSDEDEDEDEDEGDVQHQGNEIRDVDDSGLQAAAFTAKAIQDSRRVLEEFAEVFAGAGRG
jgi:hypothetical protein